LKPGIVLTDLDGTLLEPDGSLAPHAREAVERCLGAGVPVCPVTSKTADELAKCADELSLETAAGFENGAGIRLEDGRLEFLPTAVPVSALREQVDRLRRTTGVRLSTLEELDDEALAALTGLARTQLPLVRRRHATLPLVVPEGADEVLRAALPADGILRLVRGNRFLHLQGAHSKADVVDRLLRLAPGAAGSLVVCGDSPNDIELLAAGDIAIIIPSTAGPCPELLRRFPHAVIAPLPHGRGWAAAINSMLQGDRRS
jgi:mannosyl-3-phosphoglycerate phosphatase